MTILDSRIPRDVLASGDEVKLDIAGSLTQQYYESLSGDFTSCDSNEFYEDELNEDMDDIEGFSEDEDKDNHLNQFFRINVFIRKIAYQFKQELFPDFTSLLHNSSIDDILNSLVNEPLSQNYDANIQSDFYISKDVIVRHDT